jgi:hypothetical protein
MPTVGDDWRVTVDFDDEGDGADLAEWLQAFELAGEERRRLGERVIVSRDGPRVFLYTDGGERAREIERTVSTRLEHEGRSAVTSLTRWHPVEQAWKDASVPMPESPAEIEVEHERLQEREAADSLEKGYAEWEVRVELPTHDQTVELAERLEAEGIPVIRRYTFLLVGAINQDEAAALAERLREEAPAEARIDVEPSGGVAWEVMPQNPFVVFGGLGA